MGSKTTKENLNTQPNSIPRMEMLIVLEYLKECAYDENHATTQQEIIKYAKDNYDIGIRRDRIGQILIHLEEISLSTPKLLPFKVASKQINKIKKYYVASRNFTESELVDILLSIKTDDYLSIDEKNKLSRKILEIESNKDLKPDLIKRTLKYGSSKIQNDKKTINTKKLFLKACNEGYSISFSLKEINRITEFRSLNKNEAQKFLIDKSKEHIGIPIKLHTALNQMFCIVYIPELKSTMITNLSNLEIYNLYDLKLFHQGPFEYEIFGKKEKNDEWVINTFKRTLGSSRDFKLLMEFKYDWELSKFKNDFEDFWGKELVYKVMENQTSIIGDEGCYTNLPNRKIIYFEITCDPTVFIYWHNELGYFDRVTVLEPKIFNDWAFYPRIVRYAKKLNKYGKKFKVEIIRKDS